MAKPVAASVDKVLQWLFFCKVGVTVESAVVLYAVSVHSQVRHVLSTECTDQIVSLQLSRVPVHKFSPLLHFILGLLVKLVLVEIILLFEFLSHFPNHIVFELQQPSLLFVMLNQ